MCWAISEETGGKKADNIITAPTAPIATASTFEQNSDVIINKMEKKSVSKFEEKIAQSIWMYCRKFQFCSGQQLRQMVDKRIDKAYLLPFEARLLLAKFTAEWK